MSDRQIHITKSAEMLEVIAEARRTFQDADSDRVALTRALFHWLHNRQENSKRGALDRVESIVIEIRDMLRGGDGDHG